MDAIIAYFTNDPLKILYLLGGAGGVWFWIEKWRERIRISVRTVGHSFDTKLGELLAVEFEFEAVNLGKWPTSLEPHVYCSGYIKQRQYEIGKLEIQNEERILPPHSTRRFKAVGRLTSNYIFWLFKCYRICPTRGADCVIYTRAFPDNPLSWLRYNFELSFYRWFGWLPFSSDNKS